MREILGEYRAHLRSDGKDKFAPGPIRQGGAFMAVRPDQGVIAGVSGSGLAGFLSHFVSAFCLSSGCFPAALGCS